MNKAKNGFLMCAAGLALAVLLIGRVYGLQEGAAEHAEAGHAEHEEHEDAVKLTPEQVREFGVEVAVAGPGTLATELTLNGEVKLNADRLAHVVPRVAGVVRKVHKNLGDTVKSGEVMAVLESRELASLKSDYLAARERVALAQTTFEREKTLWEKKISAEQDYLEAKQALAEARIQARSAEQELHALGFAEDYLVKLPGHGDASLTQFEVVAPFDGTVIEKHVTLGEALKDDSELFVVADLSTVWVDFSVHQKDLPKVRAGQAIAVSDGPGAAEASGSIAYVGPVVGEETRTAVARVVLPNEGGAWRPGLFVTGTVDVSEVKVPLAVASAAIQTVEEKPAVFVETEGGFKAQAVEPGRSDRDETEIVKGLEPGQRYVAKGAFTLKAQLSKGAFGDGHNH
jgi:cobalt-zinc-cadmium efflux system membrane fusion protein